MPQKYTSKISAKEIKELGRPVSFKSTEITKKLFFSRNKSLDSDTFIGKFYQISLEKLNLFALRYPLERDTHNFFQLM